MANPTNPSIASSPIPPPIGNLPFGRIGNDGDVFLTPVSIEFLQTLWASIQGTGGAIDQSLINLQNNALSIGIYEGLVRQIAARLILMVPPPSGTGRQTAQDAALISDKPQRPSALSAQDASLLAQRPQIPLPIQALLDSLAVRGDVIYRSATGWALLHAGGVGQLLQTLGTAADPVWTSAKVFANLPASPSTGARDFITDGTLAAAGNFGAAAAGGGANHVPVFWDGTSWLIG